MHSSFHSNNYKGIVRKGGRLCSLFLFLSFSLSLDEYGLWQFNEKEDMATKYNEGGFFVAEEIVKRQGE